MNFFDIIFQCRSGLMVRVEYSYGRGRGSDSRLLHIPYRKQFTEISQWLHYLAPKMFGKMAVKQTRNVSANCRQEPAHNAIWPKSLRKLKTVYICCMKTLVLTQSFYLYLKFICTASIVIIQCFPIPTVKTEVIYENIFVQSLVN